MKVSLILVVTSLLFPSQKVTLQINQPIQLFGDKKTEQTMKSIEINYLYWKLEWHFKGKKHIPGETFVFFSLKKGNLKKPFGLKYS